MLLSQKYEIFPTKEQKETLDRWLQFTPIKLHLLVSTNPFCHFFYNKSSCLFNGLIKKSSAYAELFLLFLLFFSFWSLKGIF
ncbi:hypothetical protein COL91_11160 [Bacillus pseudomycoides]|nr:hypothetical protein COO02_26235 [Bacillus pseudomycoides]PEI93415.1 hypothetical protein CN679_07975 [Bacillus pseudomycoides]PGA91201.1 hypothetical protein COL91_11160 [Bacillus pseudomycoides]